MIKLYYDKIVGKMPVPNGISSYERSNTAYQIPFYNGDQVLPINPCVQFYYVSLINQTKLKLYSGKSKEDNLYYPIELNDLPDIHQRDLRPYISQKTVNKINKGQFKLLIFAQKMHLTWYSVSEFKKRLDELVGLGIDKKDIIVVFNDVNKVYRSLLGYKLIGIDWWQLYCQILYKDLYKIKQYDFYFPTDQNFKIRNLPKPVDLDNFNPKKLFKALTTAPSLSNISLILSILNNNLADYGDYYFRKDLFKMPKVEEVIDKTNNEKEKILNDIPMGLHYDYNKIDNDFNFELDNNNHLLTIICDKNAPEFYTPYKNEWSKCTINPLIWHYIFLGLPFIVYGNTDIQLYLNKNKYFTYNDIIPQHKFDSLTVMSRKADVICQNLSFIKDEEYIRYVKTIQPYAERNREIFLGRYHHNILSKLFLDIKAVSVV